MPLLDHFHPPLTPRHSWESFHSAWASAIADVLNEHLLPAGYYAEEHVHAGPRIEIDVATFADSESGESTGSVATRTYAPPAPAVVASAAFPDDFEVRVHGDPSDTRSLVAAIELVSPANKDRAGHRGAFANKCAGYLAQGVALIVVDVVTERRANLHAQIMGLLGEANTGLPADAELYAVAYRPIVRDGAEQIDVWPVALALGGELPTLPLALSAELVLPLDLYATYTTVCQRRRIA